MPDTGLAPAGPIAQPDYSADVDRFLPVWGLSLNDPSGLYGPHNLFIQLGETAEDAYAAAIARYAPGGLAVTRDNSRDAVLLSIGYSECRVCRFWNGDHHSGRHTGE